MRRLKTNEPILMQNGPSGPRGVDMNGQLWGHEVKGQGHTINHLAWLPATWFTSAWPSLREYSSDDHNHAPLRR